MAAQILVLVVRPLEVATHCSVGRRLPVFPVSVWDRLRSGRYATGC